MANFAPNIQTGPEVFIIVDGHPSHKSNWVKTFVVANYENLRLYFLPFYSPELNNDRLLSNDAKSKALGRRRPRSSEELIAGTRAHLRRRQKQQQVIGNFFSERRVRYAAAK